MGFLPGLDPEQGKGGGPDFNSLLRDRQRPFSREEGHGVGGEIEIGASSMEGRKRKEEGAKG